MDLAAASIESAEIAGPGFINFRLNKGYLYAVIKQVQEQGADYGRIQEGAGKRYKSSSSVRIRQVACTWAMHVVRQWGMPSATCLILPDTR